MEFVVTQAESYETTVSIGNRHLSAWTSNQSLFYPVWEMYRQRFLATYRENANLCTQARSLTFPVTHCIWHSIMQAAAAAADYYTHIRLHWGFITYSKCVEYINLVYHTSHVHRGRRIDLFGEKSERCFPIHTFYSSKTDSWLLWIRPLRMTWKVGWHEQKKSVSNFMNEENGSFYPFL